MRRDMDLCRQILFEIEKNDEVPIGWISIDIAGRSNTEVSYNVLQLAEAGLVEARDISTDDGLDVRPVRLRWSGHEFLDAVRKDTIWNKAKEIVKAKSGGLAFDLLFHVAKNLVLGV